MLARIFSGELRSDLFENVGHRFGDAFARIARRVPIAKLDGFVLAGRSTGRYRRAPESATLQHHLGFNRGVASGVEDLPRENGIDRSHLCLLSDWNCSGSLRAPSAEYRRGPLVTRSQSDRVLRRQTLRTATSIIRAGSARKDSMDVDDLAGVDLTLFHTL